MKIWRAIILSVVLAGCLYGASISGFVTDKSNGEPLPYADVYLDGEPLGSTTNDKGFYIIDGVKPGRHILVVGYLGYKEWRDTIEITSPAQKLKRDIALTPTVHIGEAIVVEARREGGEMDMLTGHNIVSQRQVQYTPQLLEPDLFRTIHLMPGVTAPSDFSSALYIWGGTPSQNLVTLDGIEVYNASHLGGMVSAFNVDAIKEANLIKGGFPAKWGGRIGSVLEIINREGDRKRIHGSGEVSLLSSKATFHGPLPGFMGSGAWLVSARRTYYDWITDLMARNIGDEDLKFPYHFTDFHTKLTRDFDNGDKIAATYYYGADVFDLIEDTDDGPDGLKFGWGNNTFAANFNHLFSPTHFGHFMAAYSEFKDYLEGYERGDVTDFFQDYVKDFTLRGVLTTSFPDHLLEFGLETKYLDVLNKIEFPDYGEPFWDWHNSAVVISAYGQDEWKPNPLWKFVYGLRSELCSSGWYFRMSPRFSAMRRIDERTRVKFSSGLYYQYFQSVPKFEELGLSLFDTWVLSQEGIEPSWAVHFVLRGETERLWNIPISLDIYYKRMGNLYRHKSMYAPPDHFADMFDRGEGWSSGADFLARFDAWHISGWVSYSLGFVVNSFNSIDRGEPFYPKYDRRHTVNVSFAYDIGAGWTAPAVWKLASGKPYTEPLGKYYMPDETYGDFEPGYMSDWWYFAGYNNKRVPTYHRLDVSIAKRFNLDFMDIEGYFQIVNVYYHKNVYTYDFYVDENGNIEKDPIYMLPIIPTFGLRGWF